MTKNKIMISIVVVVCILLVISLCICNFYFKPYVTNIDIVDSMQFDDMNIINVYVDNNPFKFNKDTWCLISTMDINPSKNDEGWVKAEKGYCSFTMESGDYHIYLKDNFGNVIDANNANVKINKVTKINIEKDVYYLYKGESTKINYNMDMIGVVDNTASFESSNPNIVSVDNGIVYGNDYGTAYITLTSIDGKTSTTKVIVSNFIVKPDIYTNKSYVKCNQFTAEENKLLDDILEYRINNAGYGTRAGVIEAARFLTLQFAYEVPYFFENGRLENYEPYEYVDGEGRYYHKGLFLSSSKYDELVANFVGPAAWGCDLLNFTNNVQYIKGHYYPNGFDCSGFVTWALLNGGFDVGDIGAGTDPDHWDLTDIGEKVMITDELMNSGRVKVGDLIGLNGHMAILAGWDDNNYYIAESLNTTMGVVMTTVPRNKLVYNSIYKYIILMDGVYKEDGNYSNMW